MQQGWQEEIGVPRFAVRRRGAFESVLVCTRIMSEGEECVTTRYRTAKKIKNRSNVEVKPAVVKKTLCWGFQHSRLVGWLQ